MFGAHPVQQIPSRRRSWKSQELSQGLWLNCHKVCGWPGQEECWLYLGSVGKGFWLFWARPKLWSSPAVLAQLWLNCHKVCGWPGQEECWLYLGSVGKGFWLFWARPKLWSSPAVLAQLQQVRPQATQMGKKYWEVAEISDGFRWLCRS
jgi:hypothetical protein